MDYGKVVDNIFEQIKKVRFDIRIWDGRHFRYGSGNKPDFTLIFHSEKAAKRLLGQGALGFGEAYMDGSLEIQGNIESYLKLRHQFKTIKKSPRMLLGAVLAMRTVPRQTESQIAYHYDLGNDFFSLFLDSKTMSYSAGRYEKKSRTLGAAQVNKIKLVNDWLDLNPGAEVLDLGSGWGGFASYASKERGLNITGYTLSHEQIEYCRELDLSSKTTFLHRDMLRELPKEQYDAIVMIESIEHVGKERLADYFKQLYKTVKPGGILYIQATGQYKQKTVDKLIAKYVFPGGYLPSIGELVSYGSKAGFHIEKLQDDTDDYLKTMTAWVESLEKNQENIEELTNSSFYKLWYLWMHGSKVAFEVGYMNLFRIKFVKPE